jgi:hypothetical protein
MPIFIPKPEEQAAFFQSHLEPGEQIVAPFWCEQRLPLLIAMLLEQGGALAELIFSKFRHRFFMALTDRRLLVMGSSGWHQPLQDRFESIPRGQAVCTQFTNWLGHVAMDLNLNGELRRYRVPRSQRSVAETMRSLTGAVPTV